MSSDSWFKLQGAQTEGFISNVVRSDDGGFGFSGYDDASFAGAGGRRLPRRRERRAWATSSIGTQGRVLAVHAELDAGYSAPGLRR